MLVYGSLAETESVKGLTLYCSPHLTQEGTEHLLLLLENDVNLMLLDSLTFGVSAELTQASFLCDGALRVLKCLPDCPSR